MNGSFLTKSKYFQTICAITSLNTLVGLYFDSRQYSKLNQPMPKASEAICSKDDWPKTTKYNKHKLLFGGISEIFESIRDMLFLFYVDDFHSLFASRLSNPAPFFMLAFIFLSYVSKIPLSAYEDFVIERMSGFNKKTLRIFFTDILLTILLLSCIAFPFLYVFFYIVLRFKNFEIYVGTFITLYQLFIMWIYPSVIAPIYNKFTPLEDGELKDKINKLASSVGFKVSKITVMDGSKRSGHSNAYFTGFGKSKQIVFYNTILEQLEYEEIVAVLAHELGHWNHNHTIKFIVMASIDTFSYMTAFRFIVGNATPMTVGPAFVRFIFATSSIALLMKLRTNFISRLFERQADKFAVINGYGEDLKSALVKLHSKNMSSPVIDSLYSTMNYSHPHVLERLECIDKESKRVN